MECKQGYRGPLCAVCAEHYFKSLRDCNLCANPRFGPLIGFVCGAFLLAAGVLLLVRRFQRYAHFTSVFAHLKVLVSEL
jgi:hypothetical protein